MNLGHSTRARIFDADYADLERIDADLEMRCSIDKCHSSMVKRVDTD